MIDGKQTGFIIYYFNHLKVYKMRIQLQNFIFFLSPSPLIVLIIVDCNNSTRPVFWLVFTLFCPAAVGNKLWQGDPTVRRRQLHVLVAATIRWCRGPVATLSFNSASGGTAEVRLRSHSGRKWLQLRRDEARRGSEWAAVRVANCLLLCPQAVETNLASKDSHWVFVNEVTHHTHETVHLHPHHVGTLDFPAVYSSL